MATVTIQGSRNLIYVDLNVWEASYDINNNTSQVSYSIVLRTGSKGWATSWGSWGQKIYVSYSVAGNSFTTYIPNYNYNGVGGSGTTFASGTVTVGHNADGTASIGFGVSLTDNANGKNSSGTYYTPGNAAWSESSMSLTTIPRASAIGNVSGTIGSAISISWSRASSSFTHTLQWFFGSASGTIGTGLGTSASWTPSMDLNSQIPGSTSGTGTIKLITYNGSTYVGEKTATLTLSSPSSVIPSVSFSSLTDGNSTVTAKNLGVFVYGKSYPVISATGSGTYGSTINLWRMVINGTTYDKGSLSELNSVLSGIKTLTGSQTVTLSVRDTRGRWSASASKSYTGVAYSSPTITGDSATRTNSAGTLADDGTYLKGTGTLKMSDLNSKNKMTAKWRYKKKSDSSYTDISIVSSGTSLTVDAAKLSDVLSTSYSYDVILEISDLFETNSRSYTISSGFDLIHFNASGKAMAIGKKSEKNNYLEIGLDTEFTKVIHGTAEKAKSLDYCWVGSDNDGSSGWYKFMQTTYAQYNDYNINLLITPTYSTTGVGLLNIHIRHNDSQGSTSGVTAKWLLRSGIGADHVIGVNNSGTISWYIYNPISRYGKINITVMNSMNRGNMNPSNVTLYNSTSPTTELTASYTSKDDCLQMYPVGSVYLTRKPYSPASLFGGTWQQIKGRYMFAWGTDPSTDLSGGGSDSTYQNGGATQGTALSATHMPRHSHTYQSGRWYYAETSGGGDIICNQSGTSYLFTRGTSEVGDGAAHSHPISYIQFYVWQRTG